MKFQLQTMTKCRLSSVNVRSEKHGPELVPAVDLRITLDSSNRILDLFDPELRPAFYERSAEDDDQSSIDGIEEVSDLPSLKFSKLDGPIKWACAGTGYTLTVDFGLGGDSNLVFYGCDVNNFAFVLKEGGTVEATFRVQVSNPDEGNIGKLATLVQHEVHITLDPPVVDEEDSPPENPFPIKSATPVAAVNPFTPEQALIGSAQ